MTKLSSLLLISSALISFAFSGTLRAESWPKTREFRPLMAKVVKIELASKAGAPAGAPAELFTEEGWQAFDYRDWGRAIDRFLSALEGSPSNASAAEGLTMSLYRSGDFKTAFQFSEEFKSKMPQLREMVAMTVLADVQDLIKRNQAAEAEALLAHFPSSDAVYREARGMVENCSEIKTASLSGEAPMMGVETLAGN